MRRLRRYLRRLIHFPDFSIKDLMHYGSVGRTATCMITEASFAQPLAQPYRKPDAFYLFK